MAKMIAQRNDAGLTEEAPMLAEAKDVRFVGRQTTLGTSEVNFSQSLTMMLYLMNNDEYNCRNAVVGLR
jgi:hypothetical protein